MAPAVFCAMFRLCRYVSVHQGRNLSCMVYMRLLFTLIFPEQDSHSDSQQDSDSEKSYNILTTTQKINILHEPKLIY